MWIPVCLRVTAMHLVSSYPIVAILASKTSDGPTLETWLFNTANHHLYWLHTQPILTTMACVPSEWQRALSEKQQT